ncbi:hypothetical protein VTK56DRAFT_219 [Thermocarpiscus australiensis]
MGSPRISPSSLLFLSGDTQVPGLSHRRNTNTQSESNKHPYHTPMELRSRHSPPPPGSAMRGQDGICVLPPFSFPPTEGWVASCIFLFIVPARHARLLISAALATWPPPYLLTSGVAVKRMNGAALSRHLNGNSPARVAESSVRLEKLSLVPYIGGQYSVRYPSPSTGRGLMLLLLSHLCLSIILVALFYYASFLFSYPCSSQQRPLWGGGTRSTISAMASEALWVGISWPPVAFWMVIFMSSCC